MSAAPLRRNWPSHFVTLQWKGAKFQRFAHMNYCWFSSVDEGPKEREFHFFIYFFKFLFWALLLDLLWTQKYLCKCGEGSGRTFIGWGDDTRWRSCWGTLDSMDWLLLSKRVNGVCVYVHVCQPTSIVKKSSTWFIFYLVPLNDRPIYFTADQHMHGLVFSQGLGLARNIRLLRKKHKRKQVEHKIQDSTGPQSRDTRHCFGTVIIIKYDVNISDSY